MSDMDNQGASNVVFIGSTTTNEIKNHIDTVGTDAKNLVHTESPTCELPILKTEINPLVDKYMRIQTEENLEQVKEEIRKIHSDYFDSRLSNIYKSSLNFLDLATKNKKNQEKAYFKAVKKKNWTFRSKSSYSEDLTHARNKFDLYTFIFGLLAMVLILFLGVTYNASVVVESGLISMVEEVSAWFALPIAAGALVGAITIKYTFPILFETDIGRRGGIIILFILCLCFFGLWLLGYTHTFENVGSVATVDSLGSNNQNSNMYFWYFMIGQIGMESFGGALIALTLHSLYNANRKKYNVENPAYMAYEENENKSYNEVFIATKEISNAQSNIDKINKSRDSYVRRGISYFDREVVKAKHFYYQSRYDEVYKDAEPSSELYSVG